MSDYIATLAQLTDEEQRIYRQPRLERDDVQKLAKIAQARELLWNAERARKAGAPLSDVPLDGWRVDRVGFVKPRPRPERRLPPATARGGSRVGVRDLPTGVERIRSGRVRAVCYLKDRTKIQIGTFDPTPEQIDLAGRMAEAARAARDAGKSASEIRAAAFTAYQERQVGYAAD